MGRRVEFETSLLGLLPAMTDPDEIGQALCDLTKADSGAYADVIEALREVDPEARSLGLTAAFAEADARGDKVLWLELLIFMKVCRG